MLINSRAILSEARKQGYAVGAFDINNMEMLQGVVSACLEMRSPAIIQTTEHAIEYAGIDYLAAMIKTASKLPIPMVMHLDHGKHTNAVKKCIKNGYTSVMFDGSALPFKRNIEMTRKLVLLARKKNISVEGELGRIIGKESLTVSKENIYTDPKQAKIFVEKTGIDSLAVAIGTRHGFNKGRVKLRFDLLEEIQKNVKIPLVLHGGSKLKRAEIKTCISLGIAKINIDSDLREIFTNTIKKEMRKNKDEKDPRKILGPVREAVKKLAMKKIELFGCGGKA